MANQDPWKLNSIVPIAIHRVCSAPGPETTTNETSNVEGTPAVAVQRIVSRLVDKFLSWPLPESVCSDQCACERGYPHRSGTNLLTATEAEAMIKHLLENALTKEASNEEEDEMYMRGFFDGMEHEKSATSI